MTVADRAASKTASGASSSGGVAETAEIRTHFPALQREHDGKRVAYFDGPGGTQVPRAVVDAMSDYLYEHNANTHWKYPTSEETDAAIDRARHAVADFVNGSAEEIAFGNNMTTLTFHLARALGRAWKAGDEVVVTDLDHQANVAPWRTLERERGIVVRSVPFHVETGELDVTALERAFRPRTRLLAIGAASNALGTVVDVRAAARLARAAGALVFVDAVHYAAHGVVDVRAFDCDFLSCSAYKFYGPHAGFLYGRRDSLEALDVPKLDPAPDTAPERFETGTQNHEGIVGTGAAVEFLTCIARGGSRRERVTRAMHVLHKRGDALVTRLWDGLLDIEGVRCFGPPPGRPRTPTVAFVVPGLPSEQVAVQLATQGVFVSHGDFYATTVIDRLGQSAEGVVRAGCACYTTEAEVERLVGGVRDIVAGSAR